MNCTNRGSFPLNMKKKKLKRQSLILLKYIQQLSHLVLEQTTRGGFQRNVDILVTYQWPHFSSVFQRFLQPFP